jgi:hypothetical protein
MEHESGLAVLEGFHGQSDILRRDCRELVNLMTVSLLFGLQDTDSTYTGLDQESLESSNSSLDEREQLIGVARNDTTVKTNINPALALACSKFLLEAMKGSGGRNGIERHVNDSGDTAAGSSTGTSPKTLPLCSTRLVQVNMSVDQTRNEKLGTVVDIVCAGWETRRGKDFGDDCHDLASDWAHND